jgi:PIN domain nuclease of toxin-antitoxin system
MNAYVTDTHALLWYLSNDLALSALALDLFRQADTGLTEIVIPSIVLLEEQVHRNMVRPMSP